MDRIASKILTNWKENDPGHRHERNVRIQHLGMLGMGKVRGGIFGILLVWFCVLHALHAFHLTTMTACIVCEYWQGQAQAKHRDTGKAAAERS